MVCDAGEDATSCPQDCGAPAGNCAHGPCEEGVALDPSCDACVTTVCNDDPYCCQVEWDATCVGGADYFCGCM